MLSRLPEFIDPMALVEKRQVLEGILPLAKMRRLAPMLSDAHGEVRVSMQFCRGQNRQAEVAGKVTTELKLTCQRCMETMSMPLELSFHLGIVFSLSEAEKLPEQYEPLVVDSDTGVSVVEMIEDELLLAMPAVARHPLKDCPLGGQFNTAQIEGNAEAELIAKDRGTGDDNVANKISTKENPFAVLANLKTKPEND